MHVLVWGSILVWFIIIPVTSSGAFYGSFFRYGGVANEVLNTAEFWFYLPMATVVALFPTIISRLIALYQKPAYVDFVRLKEKKEGKKLFKRKKMSHRSHGGTLKRSGYAFSHQEGFGDLITTGHIFGMDEGNVEAEHLRRRSVLLSASPSRAGTEPPMPSTSFVARAAIAAAASLSSAVVGIGDGSRSSVTTEVLESHDSDEGFAAANAEDQTAGGIPRERRRPDDDHTTLQSVEPSVEEPRGSVQDQPGDETDSALMPPSLKIPGLVDSPEHEEEEVAEEQDQEDTAGAAGESEKAAETFPVV